MSASRSTAGSPLPKCKALYLCLLLLACLPISSRLPATVSAAQESSSQFSIRKEVSLVVLPVTVTDRNGQFVTGLDQANFHAYEDGKPQEITLFRHEDIPVAAGLLVDHSGSMAPRQLEVIAGAQAFVQASNPQDREFVINFSGVPSFGLPSNMDFTSRVDDLVAALSTPYATGKTALYDAVAVALKRLQDDPLDKRVLLLISDGGDNASTRTLAQVLREAQAANVVIYAIGLLDEHNADQNPDVLKKFARDTGGQAYFPNSLADLLRVCQDIAADIRHQYTIGYSPPDASRAGYRKVRVSLTAPGRGRLTVRTRTSYFIASNTSSGPVTPNGQSQ
jgi:Ca-activated chloride channel family protein